ncbi:TonB-dependent receptor [Flavobacterium laiguense]|uniref:TonB-dependent receptor n=1 Tax=Flavobacterium laiguense TaxID=2169409 RepID=A0A2U1JS46_9FLAO|nr:TonB-dependent receptor [Flavobacterium laiguense]PWA07638.1 TonB-dependent receptor [Flavobacterium laiguense]
MKLKYIIAFLVFSCTSMSAQFKITGNVVTTASNPVVFAEVILIGEDAKNRKSELTNDKGDFVLEVNQGNYILEIRQVNELLFTKNISLTAALDLGVITIDNAIQLESVVVGVKKELIERKVDRLVFNVENSINATGGDALEALRVTPGIKVQNDNITIIGKSNLAVMIDDKIIQLSEEDLANYLKSIPSDNIKSIEVITTPPAKYEAEGKSGLVNIKLKKAKKDSWNALVGSTYLQRFYSQGAVMGNFNYNKNKLGITSSLNYLSGKRYNIQDDYTYFPTEMWHTNSSYKSVNTRIYGKFGIDYQITPKWIVGGQTLFNNSQPLFTDSPFTGIYDNANGNITSYLKSNGGVATLKVGISSFNFYNEFKIDSLGKKITLNLDYFNYKTTDSRTYNGISVVENPYSQQYFAGINSNIQGITNVSGKLDFDYPTKWATLSFGGKVSNSKSNNNISAFNSGLVDKPVLEMPFKQSEFDYTENIQAVYLSGSKKINDHWDSQFGLRMETTQTKIFAGSLSQSINKDYIKFFPTAYLIYIANDNSTFSFSYSKRIERPQFRDLNPNTHFWNPFQSFKGNPFLQPAFIDNTELTYTYKKIESKFYFSYENNLISEVTIVDPNSNEILHTSENYIDTQRYGISENYVFDGFKWWTSNNAVDFNYAISKSSLTVARREQKGFNSRLSTNNDFNLNADKTLLFNVSYWYSFPGIDGISTNREMSSFSLAFQYLLWNKDLKMSLRGTDIFKTEKINSSSTVNGVYQEGKNYYDNQSFQLSVSYKFGNKKSDAKQRVTGNEEERSRTGS